MSEKQRLLSDRGDGIAEEHESNGITRSSSHDKKALLNDEISQRNSLPHNNSNLNYGTISDIKYQPLIGPGGITQGPQSHFTKKQTLIALFAFFLFSAGVAITLILGLPRLEAKRREYFEAKFYESPFETVSYTNKAILLNSAPECSHLARDQETVIDSTIIAVLCSLIATPHLIRPDSRLSGIYIQNGTYYDISTQFQSIKLQKRYLASPTIFQSLYLIHQKFNSVKNFSDILDISSKLASNGVPMTNGLADVINKNLEKKYKWKSDFLQVTTSVDGTVRPGQTIRNPALSKFLFSFNGTNIQELIQKDLSIIFGEEVNMTEPEVSFGVPLQTNFLKLKVLTSNSGCGLVLNRFLRIQESLNEDFNQCNSKTRTLKDGTKEFHYLIESLKHSLQALTSNQIDSEENIFDISEKIYSIKENNISPLKIKEYGYSDDSLSLIKMIQKRSKKRSFHLLIHDSQSGDAIVLVAQNRRDLFEGDKFASKTMGFVLDMFEKSEKKEYSATPEALPTIVLNPSNEFLHYILSSEYDSCSAIAQVLSKLTFGCKSLKNAIDESRIFFVPKKNQVLIEDKFPRAYIDLLMRLYGHMNIETTSNSEQLSSVFAIERQNNSSTSDSVFDLMFKELFVFFDWRSRDEGFLNGN